MTRFHFNIYNSIGFVPDEEGRELPGPAEARAEGLKGAGSIIADAFCKDESICTGGWRLPTGPRKSDDNRLLRSGRDSPLNPGAARLSRSL